MIFDRVKAVIVENLNCDESIVKMEATIAEDLEADSLAVVEMTMALEEAFGITIADEDLQKFVTVGDIVKYIEQCK